MAALATLDKMQRVDVPAHAERIGRRMQEHWRRLAAKHRLPVAVPDDYPCLAHFSFKHELSEELRTLYTQALLERGFLAGVALYVTLAHTEEIVDRYAAAVDEVFGELAAALAAGEVTERLKGPVAHATFRRLA